MTLRKPRVGRRSIANIRERLLSITEFNLDTLDSLVAARVTRTQREADRIFEENHAQFSTDAEYFYTLIRRGNWKKKELDECEKLILKFGGLVNVFNASLLELEIACSNMGLSVSARFIRTRLNSVVAFERNISLSRVQIAAVTEDYQALSSYVSSRFATSKIEEVLIMYLDRDDHVVGDDKIAKGEDSHIDIKISSWLAYALRAGAKSFIVAHNRMAGGTQPSERELELTRRLQDAASIVGITLFDHIIVCGTAWFSFRIAGILENLHG